VCPSWPSRRARFGAEEGGRGTGGQPPYEGAPVEQDTRVMRDHSAAVRPSTAAPRRTTSLKLRHAPEKKLRFLSKHHIFRVRFATTPMFKDH